jgi:hypothetical protein
MQHAAALLMTVIAAYSSPAWQGQAFVAKQITLYAAVAVASSQNHCAKQSAWSAEDI